MILQTRVISPVIEPRKHSWARKRRVPKVGALGEVLAHSAFQIIRSHLIGDEKLFGFARCVKSLRGLS